MEPEERFQRIETLLERTAEIGLSNQTSIAKLIVLQEDNQKALGSLIASIDAYVDEGRERTKRLEENLDALIRAITTEHKNGKTK